VNEIHDYTPEYLAISPGETVAAKSPLTANTWRIWFVVRTTRRGPDVPLMVTSPTPFSRRLKMYLFNWLKITAVALLSTRIFLGASKIAIRSES
jgi:hypothetical protein